ncbi:MAG TPA: HAMP domain-containing sensor histidine kinase [Candidatus Saccharimonas sp.]|nr:HAMP domain-containing sensor histidine kinase [Candidatus Saccharimonas sp.]
MFKNAYLRMTLWYVAILMVISLAFSLWVYHEAMQEVHSGLDGPVAVRIQDRLGPLTRQDFETALQQQYDASRGRILVSLLLLNGVVLVAGGFASYGLARRTMRPIERAVDAQNRFTADASHELRTPLAAMKTELEVSLRDPNLTKTDMKELLESNLEEINRLSDLSQALLSLARPGEALHLTAVETGAVVKEVCQRLQPLADAKKITIDDKLQSVTVMSEPKTLATIVGVLVDNAIKYSPESSKITITTRRQDNHGFITVTDQGAGIPAADLPHIFDRFYRADSSRTTQTVGGYGLGLSIAQKMVVAMHGSIIAQSTSGKGCIFTVKLPIA